MGFGKIAPKGEQDTYASAQETPAKPEKATEELNKALADTEEAFADLRLGVRTSIELDADEHETRYIAFGKLNGQWKLMLEVTNEDPEGATQYTPLLNCSREVRMAAVPLLPKLLAGLV